jgi:hypothetical protein
LKFCKIAFGTIYLRREMVVLWFIFVLFMALWACHHASSFFVAICLAALAALASLVLAAIVSIKKTLMDECCMDEKFKKVLEDMEHSLVWVHYRTYFMWARDIKKDHAETCKGSAKECAKELEWKLTTLKKLVIEHS